MERNRLYNRDHPHRESPESRKKSNRRYRISSYGLTQELFDLLLEAQRWATSNADMRWLAPTWTALRSDSSTPPSLQPGKALRRDCRHLP
jgi:hypothetical protein